MHWYRSVGQRRTETKGQWNMASWTDPYKKIREQEKEERDYREGFQDGDYSKRGQTCAMRYQEDCTPAYNRGFKEASGYTPREWASL